MPQLTSGNLCDLVHIYCSILSSMLLMIKSYSYSLNVITREHMYLHSARNLVSVHQISAKCEKSIVSLYCKIQFLFILTLNCCFSLLISRIFYNLQQTLLLPQMLKQKISEDHLLAYFDFKTHFISHRQFNPGHLFRWEFFKNDTMSYSFNNKICSIKIETLQKEKAKIFIKTNMIFFQKVAL